MLVVATSVPPVFEAVVLLNQRYELIVVKVVGVITEPLGLPLLLHNDWFVFGILTVGNGFMVTVAVITHPLLFV